MSKSSTWKLANISLNNRISAALSSYRSEKKDNPKSIAKMAPFEDIIKLDVVISP
jgi:hypothetical protein